MAVLNQRAFVMNKSTVLALVMHTLIRVCRPDPGVIMPEVDQIFSRVYENTKFCETLMIIV